MSWNMEMDSDYVGSATSPYNSGGSFIDFFAGLTYDHVNFIFAASSPMQDNAYSPVSTGYYKFGYSEPGPNQYYNNSHSYDVYDHLMGTDEYGRRSFEFVSPIRVERTTETNRQNEGMPNTNVNMRTRDRPTNRPDSQDFEVIWQDNIDPDNMTYEELLELGDTVGTHNPGLSQEQISMLPVSRFTCCFLRKKSRCERCVICQMEYKRRDHLITLPCKHRYHLGCANKWLAINKACPICYTEVFIDAKRK